MHPVLYYTVLCIHVCDNSESTGLKRHNSTIFGHANLLPLVACQKDLPGDMRYCHPGRSQEWVFADVPYRHSWLMAQRWKFSLENGTRTVIDLPLCLTIAKIVGCHNFLSARYREVSTEY